MRCKHVPLNHAALTTHASVSRGGGRGEGTTLVEIDAAYTGTTSLAFVCTTRPPVSDRNILNLGSLYTTNVVPFPCSGRRKETKKKTRGFPLRELNGQHTLSIARTGASKPWRSFLDTPQSKAFSLCLVSSPK